MFVVFEGIDGSGKTTVSNRVAKALRARGFDVDHIREGGEFTSPVVERMREFGKDTRNMALRPLSEFLMYVARDAQLLAECVNPALSHGGLVFADRYLYSYEVLGHYGRGLEMEQVRPIIETVADGVWPDLVVLMDVDPHLARARRRVSKLKRRADGEDSGSGSRKGLGGKGMMHRLRQGYLKLAEREPTRWLVIDNSNTDLQMVVDRVSEAIASLYEGASTARVVAGTEVRKRAATSADAPTLGSAREAFYDMIATRRVSEPKVAAYFLAGLLDTEAHNWRLELLQEAPDIVAYGLRGLGDESSWELRHKLMPSATYFVARSLSGLAVEGERADEMRKVLRRDEPQAVLATLTGQDRPIAWDLRQERWDLDRLAVVESLCGLGCEQSWEWRDRFVESAGGDCIYTDLERSRALIKSLKGLGDDRSWDIRERCKRDSPAEILRSLSDLDCERSWAWRDEFAQQAPKIVLRSFDGQDSDRAWAMRQSFASRAKEALDSMMGMAGDRAWSMREAMAEVWPSTVAKSLGDLASSQRGLALIESLLAQFPENLSLLKHATQVAAADATAGAARRSIVDAS